VFPVVARSPHRGRLLCFVRHGGNGVSFNRVGSDRVGRVRTSDWRVYVTVGKLKLAVNEEKTRICKVPEGEFDFLGYTFGRMYSPTTGKARLGHRPSKKSIK
jgi:hypothetical protein